MSETFVVTGGAGFIGSHLVERLLHDGCTVRVIDNFLTGRRANVQHLSDDAALNARLSIHEVSITDLEAIVPVIDGADYVLHHAALPSVPRSVADPLETHAHCVTGTLNVLEAARRTGVKRVVYASSSSIYGDIEGDAKIETMPPQPKSPYGAAKLAGEYYCRVFSETYGLETVSLRYFNVFGPRQDPMSEYAAVIPKFIALMLDDRPPLIYGDGTQSRDFTFVENVVEGNLLAARTPGVGGSYMNLATGGRITLLDLVDQLNGLLGSHWEAVHEPERTGDIKHSRASIDKAQALLGYQPLVDFETGLARTVAWFEAQTIANE
ncbi:MAG: SDR family oxidoreductase [Anaerolineae bacterium]|nr:SDR family oxidoreductase [Anaerolineae bacterium]